MVQVVRTAGLPGVSEMMVGVLKDMRDNDTRRGGTRHPDEKSSQTVKTLNLELELLGLLPGVS
jgi:hypothetical protein